MIRGRMTAARRRSVWIGIGGVLVLVASWAPGRLLAIASQLQAGAAQPARPNILMVIFDDLNDWTGVNGGHPQALTPSIDAIAARGTNFTSAHVQAALCNPSRSSFLSGLRPSTTGIYALQPSLRTALAETPGLADHVNLPEFFTRQGYHTLTVGKVFHTLEPEYREREFDTWLPTGGRGARPPERLGRGEGVIGVMDWGPFPERDEDTGDYQVASAAVEALQTMPRDRPFFLAVGFSLPHVPIYAPPRWFERLPSDQVQLPPLKRGDRDDTPFFSWYLHWRLPEPRLSWYERYDELVPFVRAYLAGTTFVDAQLGRVLAALHDAGLDENTVIVAFGDHGYHLGEQEISGKNSLWERSTHVPFVMAGPGVPRRDVDDPVEILDLYPTLAELAGFAVPDGLEGLSLVPQFSGQPRTRPAITTSNQGSHAIRTSRWRYIRYADGSEELYDRQADPNEWTNLAGNAQYREVIGELAQWLPPIDREAVPGSTARALTRGPDGGWLWEGTPIVPSELER